MTFYPQTNTELSTQSGEFKQPGSALIQRIVLTHHPRYSAFQIVGAWANTGYSLVDQNLIPFQTAYPLLIFMVWLALAGNTGFVSALWIYFTFDSQPTPQPILYVWFFSSMHGLKESRIFSLRLCMSVSRNS